MSNQHTKNHEKQRRKQNTININNRPKDDYPSGFSGA